MRSKDVTVVTPRAWTNTDRMTDWYKKIHVYISVILARSANYNRRELLKYKNLFSIRTQPGRGYIFIYLVHNCHKKFIKFDRSMFFSLRIWWRKIQRSDNFTLSLIWFLITCYKLMLFFSLKYYHRVFSLVLFQWGSLKDSLFELYALI